MNFKHDVIEAKQRISLYLAETPLERLSNLSQFTGCNVFAKLENMQPTGSFKIRGAFNKLLMLPAETLQQGIVTASSGNHGAAVAYAGAKLGTTVTVFVPTNACDLKTESIQRLGATLRFQGSESGLSELYARSYAQEHGLTYISPYNDPQVIAGQGTTGFEIARQLPDVDVIFVAVGGGGLASGIAGFLQSDKNRVAVIGCSPKNTAAMAASVKAGRIIEVEHRSTLSDGTAGGIENGSITFEFCRDLIDDWILITEQEIIEAMQLYNRDHKAQIEGAAGVAIAGYLKRCQQLIGKNIVIVICGGNRR